MTDDADNQSTRPSSDDKALVEAMVAECIEALENGEADPAARVCAGRPDVLPRVQHRLARLASRGLIANPGPSVATRIGPYQILSELGSGGMGSVYLAEQSQPVRRQVALKVIKLGMDTREEVARFQAERQALALMSHPNIAQVFDAGITDEGRPYFAMEYVPGQGLLEFCDDRRLATIARIRLLATICRAIQHAHDRGFIHRDLKPSNMLVAEHGGQFTPKIIDFGIAKAAANAALAAENLQTRADQILGTPEYMSPEHARSGGLDVDTRADVYSLGVVMYELLCGELPFDPRRLRRATRSELEQILQHELPTLPSKRVSKIGDAAVEARNGERSSLQRSMAGDLDWITLKALAKQREQRYASPLALAEDLERWLNHEPVLAAPPGSTYRLRKFVRRHRVAVGATAIVVVTLLGGLVVSLNATVEAQAARTQATRALDDMRAFYDLARDAVGNLVDVADAGLADVPQADAIRRRMLADAIRFYEGLRARQPSQLDLRIDLVDANKRIGFLQQRIGLIQDAVATLTQASRDVAALRDQHPLQVRLLCLAVELDSTRSAALYADGQLDAAQLALRQGLATLLAARDTIGDQVTNFDFLEATLLGNLAWISDDDPLAATALFEQALAAYARVPQRGGSGSSRDQAMRMTTAARYAEALTRQNRLVDAARVLAETAKQLPNLPADAPDTPTSLRELAGQLQKQTAQVLRRLDRHDEARAAQAQAITIYRQLAADQPDVLSYADGEAAGWHFLAEMQAAAGEPAQAIASSKRCVAIRERLALDHPQDHRQRGRTVRSLMLQASAEFVLWQNHGGDKVAAEATLARAVAIADELAEHHGDDIESLVVFAAAHSAVALRQMSNQKFVEALAEQVAVRDRLQQGLIVWSDNANLHYLMASCAATMLKVQFQMGRMADAVAAGVLGMQHVERGLQLDARDPALLSLAPDIYTLSATAQFRNGEAEAGMTTLLALIGHTEWGPDAREQACLLLVSIGDFVDNPQQHAWLQRAASEMRTAITARGTLAAALQRPAQATGYSHASSRLRDFDLRLSLAEIYSQLEDSVQQDEVLQEAEALAASLPGMTGNRLRNLCDQRAGLLIAGGQPMLAMACVEQLLTRVHAAGGCYYMAALLLARCCTVAAEPNEVDRLAARAVACLQLALEHREVPANAIRHPNFEPLQARADYVALLARIAK